MWNELQLSPAFFMQYVKQNTHHILLTDYIRIWEIHLSDKELLHCLMDSNTILEMEEAEILQNGVQLLTHPQDLKKVNIIYDGACLVISMTLFREFPFKIKLNFLEGSKELFFQKVVQPALKTIYDLKSSENELRKLLKKKDEEIDEYILQSRKIRYTSLPKYNDEVHMKKHSEYSTNFGTGEIPSTLLKKTVNIFKENDIYREDTNVKIPVKIEPQSQEITIDQPPMNSLIQVKQECIKNELPKPKKRRQINL